MSIRVMTLVWANSRQSGGALLVLLAIADFADDNGAAYPSIDTLSKKARMSERNTQYVLRELVKADELAIERGAGPKGANLYRVKVSPNLALFDEGAKAAQGANTAPGAEVGRGGAKQRTKGVKPIAPESSGTVTREPSGASRAPAKPAPEAPTTAAWHAYCEEMQGAHGMTPPRSATANGQLTTLIKRVGAQDAVKLVRHFFAVKNDFYARRGHELGLLLTDCQKLLIGMHQAERATGAATDRWWEDPAKVAERAKREGIKPIDGDSYARMSARLFVKLGDGPWMHKLDPLVAQYVREYSTVEAT